MSSDNCYVQCRGFSQDPKTSDYIMVMDFAPAGSLYTYLNDNVTWKDRITALLDISIGLNMLHSNDLVHMDFHPGNLLFNSENTCLLTDFGLCEPINQNSQSDNACRVMPYMAPEVINGKPYTKAADIYSFGMIMYFIATGSRPFGNITYENLALTICDGNRPDINDELKVPKCYIDLMKKCWDSDPNDRPSISKIEELIRKFYQVYHQYENYDDDFDFENYNKYLDDDDDDDKKYNNDDNIYEVKEDTPSNRAISNCAAKERAKRDYLIKQGDYTAEQYDNEYKNNIEILKQFKQAEKYRKEYLENKIITYSIT